MEDQNNSDNANDAVGAPNIDSPNTPPSPAEPAPAEDNPAPGNDGASPAPQTGADVVENAHQRAGEMQASRGGAAPDAA